MRVRSFDFQTMQQDFNTIAILGGGLLGGSIALAAQNLPNPPDVRLWSRREITASTARDLGIRAATSDLADAVCHADLAILCVPVGAMPGLLRDAIAAGLPNPCLVTDVGSVKSHPHRELPGLGRRFIGSHPMAGSEKKGIEAVHPTLFHQAACIMTDDGRADPSDQSRLERFWKSLGCRTSWSSPDRHDHLVARISHLPHVVAACAARVCLRNPEDGRFGGGGLRDTTRVAGGDPRMWAEILLENRDALIQPMRETLADLTEILAMLEHRDEEAIRQWLDEAKHLRQSSHIAV